MGGMRRILSAAFGEEGEQEGGGFVGEDAGGDLDLMIQTVLGKKFEAGLNRAALGLRGAINETRNTRLDRGACAHDARFEGDVERGAGKAMILQGAGGGAKNYDFGVRSGIDIANSAIAGTGENLAVVDKYGADRDFAGGGGGASFFEREAHEIDVGIHGGVRITRKE